LSSPSSNYSQWMSLEHTKLVKAKLRQVLNRAASILFPLQREEIQKLVKPHTWRDHKYVGEVSGKVCAWSGYSINLAYLDSRYRGLFGDYVQNHLPVGERLRLFGNDLAKAIQSLPSFVVLFNLDGSSGVVVISEANQKSKLIIWRESCQSSKSHKLVVLST